MDLNRHERQLTKDVTKIRIVKVFNSTLSNISDARFKLTKPVDICVVMSFYDSLYDEVEVVCPTLLCSGHYVGNGGVSALTLKAVRALTADIVFLFQEVVNSPESAALQYLKDYFVYTPHKEDVLYE